MKFIEPLVFFTVLEGEARRPNNEQNYTACEYINRRTFIRLLAVVQLGSHIWNSSTRSLQLNVFICKELHHAEICDFQRAILVQENIFKFKIAVCPPLVMEVLDAVEDLGENLAR